MPAPPTTPPATPAESPARASARALLDDLGAVVDLAGRADLAARLATTRERVADPRARVVVVGEFRQGKSHLVNSLLGIPVCAVGDDVTTRVPTVVAHAPEARAVVHTTGPGGDEPGEHPVEPADLEGVLTGTSPVPGGGELVRAEVGVPHPLLAEGLVLVDTPGAGGAGSRHAGLALGLLPTADAVLFLSDASQEYTEPELAFLQQVLALCPTVGCLLTKIDLYPQWREIGAADRAHLDAAGISASLVAVSGVLRDHALRAKDAELNRESGFPDLLTFLRHRVVGRAETLVRTAVGLDVTSVTEHLTMALRTEVAALRDPAVGERVMGELAEAKARAEELQQRSARWQTTLNDGATDLLNDLEHDLRDRMRRVTASAEQAVDAVDPGQTWEEYSGWLEDEVVRAVCDNFVWAHERAVWLAETVGDHFAEVQEVALPELDLTSTEGVLEPVTALGAMDPGRLKASQKLLVGMRGSYGGVLMFGMVTSLLGLALVNPISIGAGVLLGTKAYKDDKEQRLTRRRAEAKQATRRFIDEVVFQVNKQSKDRLRGVQRQLRDHFTVVAAQTLRSLNDSLAAGRAAAGTAEKDRTARAAELDRQLRTLGELRARAAALADVAPA